MKKHDFTAQATSYAEDRADQAHLQKALADAFLAGAEAGKVQTLNQVVKYCSK